MSVIAAVTGAIGIFGKWTEHKNKLTLLDRQAEVDLAIATTTSKIKLAESQHENNSKIDLASINKKGWMDELIGVIAFGPLAMMLLVAPTLAVFEQDSYALENILLFGQEVVIHATTSYSDRIFTAYEEAFTRVSNLPVEYWWGVGLAFIHFLGMRGFVTQLASTWGNKFSFGLGKTKK